MAAKNWWQHTPQAGAMAEYTRALAVSEGLWEDPDEIEGIVDVRVKRQARLSGSKPLQFYAVIGESALRQQVGGPDVMRAQLQHLAKAAQLPNVRVQVLPFRAGSHPCIAGSFNIISFAETEAVDVVHVDSIAATVWIENDAESAMYRTFFDRTARLRLHEVQPQHGERRVRRGSRQRPRNLRLTPTAWARFTASLR